MLKAGAELDTDALKQMRQEIHKEMETARRDLADAIFDESQRRVPVRAYMGGTLKNSGSVIHGQGYSMIGYGTPYARPVHDGFPTHRQQVRAHTRNYGGLVVTVGAHQRIMPARTGRPYLDGAVEHILKKLPKEVRDQISIERVRRG